MAECEDPRQLFTQMFKLFDIDGDGFVTMSENLSIAKALAGKANRKYDEAQCRSQFTQSDANKDGEVSLDEFLAFNDRSYIKPAREFGGCATADLCSMLEDTNAYLKKAHAEVVDTMAKSEDPRHLFTQMFKLFDVDGNGSLTMSENLSIAKALAEKANRKYDEAECRSQFTQSDANKDGEVSLDEFLSFNDRSYIKPAQEFGGCATADLCSMLVDTNTYLREAHAETILRKTSEGPVKGALVDIFNLNDLDGNGYITMDEMLCMGKALAKQFGQVVDEDRMRRLRASFERKDLDHDGRVSKDEYVGYMYKTMVDPAKDSGTSWSKILSNIAHVSSAMKSARAGLAENASKKQRTE